VKLFTGHRYGEFVFQQETGPGDTTQRESTGADGDQKHLLKKLIKKVARENVKTRIQNKLKNRISTNQVAHVRFTVYFSTRQIELQLAIVRNHSKPCLSDAVGT